MKCRSCLYTSYEEADETEKLFGLEKVCYCTKYASLISKFGNQHILLQKTLAINEDTERLCGYFKQLEEEKE